MGHSNTSYLSNISIFHFQRLEKEYPIRLDKNAAYLCFWIGFFGPTSQLLHRFTCFSPWRRMSPQSVENDLGSMYISFSYKLLMFEKVRNYDDNHEWPEPESQVVINLRKTHASKSTRYNPLTWKLLRNHPSPFKTNNHHRPKSSQLFDHPATWTSKCEKPKLWIKSSADPSKTRLDPRVGEAQPSEAVAMGEMVSWVGRPRRPGRNGRVIFGWWYLGPKFCTEKSWVQVNSLPVLDPGLVGNSENIPKMLHIQSHSDENISLNSLLFI